MTDHGMSPHPEPRRFRVATIAGTTVDVRISFVVLAGAFVLLDLDRQVALNLALLWIPVLFVSVLIHELAHAGTIAAFGHGPSAIELGGWGGETVNRRRAKPWQEVLISLAGPASSIALAYLVLWILMSVPHAKTHTLLLAFLEMMVFANQAWGIFNLIPILPLEGGADRPARPPARRPSRAGVHACDLDLPSPRRRARARRRVPPPEMDPRDHFDLSGDAELGAVEGIQAVERRP